MSPGGLPPPGEKRWSPLVKNYDIHPAITPEQDLKAILG